MLARSEARTRSLLRRLKAAIAFLRLDLDEASMRGRPGVGDLWGKFRDESQDGPAWHPLIDHCTDVACVLEALLHQPTIRRRLVRAGGQDDLHETQVAGLCFLAFIHDLGKCALGFRAKAVPELGRTAGHLAALRPLLSGPLVQDLKNLLDLPQLHAWAGDALEAFLIATLAHHGRTPKLEYDQGSDVELLRGWTGLQREPLRRLAELVDAGRTLLGDAFSDRARPWPQASAFQHLFAGLLMLADWLASADEADRFPLQRAAIHPAPTSFALARRKRSRGSASSRRRSLGCYRPLPTNSPVSRRVPHNAPWTA
jgi:CRISPR-associated endonuclease Cas3-HD